MLFAILIATIVILTILVRNLIRDFKKDLLAQVREGMIPVLKKLDELEQGGSNSLPEDLDEKIRDAFMGLHGHLDDIGWEIRSLSPAPGQGPSSYMMGHYGGPESMGYMQTGMDYSPMSTGPGHSIHVFRNGSWELQEDFSKAGYEASRPSMEGSYEGQVVRTISQSGPEDGS